MLTFVLGNRGRLQTPRETAMRTTRTAKFYCEDCGGDTQRVVVNGQPQGCPYHQVEMSMLSEPPENLRPLESY
jgi:hypothetical protein